MKPPNMTAPQWRLLQDIHAGKVRTCSSSYSPALRLWALSMIETRPQRYGADAVFITMHGRNCIEQYAK